MGCNGILCISYIIWIDEGWVSRADKGFLRIFFFLLKEIIPVKYKLFFLWNILFNFVKVFQNFFVLNGKKYLPCNILRQTNPEYVLFSFKSCLKRTMEILSIHISILTVSGLITHWLFYSFVIISNWFFYCRRWSKYAYCISKYNT